MIIMSTNEIIQILKDNRRFLADNYGITQIGVFGSYILNQQTEKSDIDIAIEMDKKKKNIHNFLAVKRFLEQLLEKKIDLGFEHSLKPSVKEFVSSNIIYVK